jgi:hypothetical protein
MSIPTSEFDRVVRERNRVEAERNALRAAIQAADERAKRQRGIITRLTDENETLSWQIAAVETVRRNLADAMRLGGDAGHVMDGRWILRRLDGVLPLAAAGVDREQQCNAESGYLGYRCDLPAGHDGRHRTHTETWWLSPAGQVVPQQPTCEHGETEWHEVVVTPLLEHRICPGPVGQDTTGGYWSRGHWISAAEAAWDNAGAGQQPDDEDELLCIHGKPFFQHDDCDDKIVFTSGDTTGDDE